MKPAITPILFIAFALPLCAEEPRTVKLTLSPETTYLIEPQLPDGRIDYIAILNKKLSAQTTPENNLLVGINSLIPGEWEVSLLLYPEEELSSQKKYREQFWKMIGADLPPLDSLVEIFPLTRRVDHTEYEKILLESYSKEEFSLLIEKQREREKGWRKSSLDEGKITQEEYEKDIKRIEKEIPDWYYLHIVEDMRMETFQRPWTAKEFPFFAHWLATRDDLAKKLMNISRQRTGYYHPLLPTTPSYAMPLPYVQSLRELARFFQMRGNFEFARGNFDQAMECAFAAIRIGHTTRKGAGCVVEELVGIAITGMGNYQLTRYLAELPKEVDAAWILQKKKEYDAINTESSPLPWSPVWYLGIRFEALETIQTLAIEPKVTREFFDGDDLAAKFDKLFDTGIEYDWDEIMRRVNFLYDDFEEILLIPNGERRSRALTRFEQRILEYGKRDIDSDDAPEQKAVDFISHTFAIHNTAVVWAATRAEWDNRVTGVAFALAAYRADNGGESPDSLEQLIPKYLDTIPDSPFTDKPLRYIKRQNDVLIANDDTFKLDGSEEAVEKLIAEAKPGARAYPQVRSFVLVVSKR